MKENIFLPFSTFISIWKAQIGSFVDGVNSEQ